MKMPSKKYKQALASRFSLGVSGGTLTLSHRSSWKMKRPSKKYINRHWLQDLYLASVVGL
jgi:hypothetical protein